MAYWLLKTEPESFGIDHLASLPRRTAAWDGVRNYQARNFLRDGVRRGDQALLYHSSCAVPGIAGIVKVVRAAYPDATAFDPRHAHYDPGSDRGRAALVRDRRAAAAAPGAAHHARRAARARARQVAWHDPAPARQSTLGDAGQRRSLALHPVARASVSEFTSSGVRPACLFFYVSCIYSVPGLT